MEHSQTVWRVLVADDIHILYSFAKNLLNGSEYARLNVFPARKQEKSNTASFTAVGIKRQEEKTKRIMKSGNFFSKFKQRIFAGQHCLIYRSIF